VAGPAKCFIPRVTDLTNANKHRITAGILAAYAGAALVLAVIRDVAGTGSLAATATYGLVFIAVFICWQRIDTFGDVVGWAPFLALPALYSTIPWSTPWAGREFDGVVQHWEQLVFGTQPSRALAAAVPSWWVGGVLHLAYLSYYAIIYLPPLVMWIRDRRGFAQVSLAFTLAMVACFAAFTVFPVAGPRYLGSSWPGDGGAIRQVVLAILERGSSRGTAFPSSHVAIALAIAWSSVRRRPVVGWGLVAVTFLLGLGAVYGGFHYGVDVVAGAVVGGASAWWAGWVRETAAPA
jgi:membrane-associated phospholipid phosphatase